MVLGFEQIIALEDVLLCCVPEVRVSDRVDDFTRGCIGSRTCLFEACTRVTESMPLGVHFLTSWHCKSCPNTEGHLLGG
jgi:hypothetical protein